MSDERLADSAKAAWRAQLVEVLPMSYLRLRALEHEKYVRNRSVLEFGAAGAALLFAAYFAIVADSVLLRAGVAVLAAGVVYWLYVWRAQRLTWRYVVGDDAADALTSYTRELGRLRDAHRRLCKAHLVAAVPGALLLSVWMVLEAGTPFSGRWWQALSIAGAAAVWIGVMSWHEVERARDYERELEALEQSTR
jgi:hypothetical protein